MAFFGGLTLVRLVFEQGLAAIFLIAFAGAFNDFPALLGERGLLPVPLFLGYARFRDAPSLFHWRYSDRLLRIVAGTGMVIAALILAGVPQRGPFWVPMIAWLLEWAFYLSIVNVGQTFYGFGWESMLVEAGFFAAFLGPASLAPSPIVILIFRWMLFRVEFGAGLIKLRHDECWRNLTCLYYHYETQPLPNPLSRSFHRIPKPMQRFSVLFSHFVQLVMPFGVFAPQPIASICGGFLILHQLLLIVSGNYSWLNWLTVVLGITALDDRVLHAIVPLATKQLMPRPIAFEVIVYALAVFTIVLSIKPALNLVSRRQLMNYSYNRYHLVNAYGAFGSVTKVRYEIVIEGTADDEITASTEWREYRFKAKPGDPMRRPPQIAPYHLRLDWLMWFLPFSVVVTEEGIFMRGYEMWFVRFVQKLLEGDRQTLGLMRVDPFRPHAPKFIRAQFYKYEFTTPGEKRETGAWWKRTRVDQYLPSVSLADLARALNRT